MQSERT